MTTISKIAVFKQADWHHTAQGRWEAQAGAHHPTSPPPFEAVITLNTAGTWRWHVYQTDTNDPDAILHLCGEGHAPTLAHAQRAADHRARHQRDHPHDTAQTLQLGELTGHSVVTCDHCQTNHRLDELLFAGGTCDALLPNGGTCNSTDYNGHSIDTLADAVI